MTPLFFVLVFFFFVGREIEVGNDASGEGEEEEEEVVVFFGASAVGVVVENNLTVPSAKPPTTNRPVGDTLRLVHSETMGNFNPPPFPTLLVPFW